MSQLAKIKSFTSSTSTKKALGKKHLKKQKKTADEGAAAQVYQEFDPTFEDIPKQGKFYVRGNVNYAFGEELSATQSAKPYKPNKLHKIVSKTSFESKTSEPVFKSEKQPKKKSEIKQKNSLELKLIQEEREERHRLKVQLQESCFKISRKLEPNLGLKLTNNKRNTGKGSIDTGNPNTTNIYAGNLNPKMTVRQLCEIFGKYGPLASVRIMWPRNEKERSRNSNFGFVAFLNRKDGERAIKGLNDKNVMDYKIKLEWAKPAPSPPEVLVELFESKYKFVIKEFRKMWPKLKKTIEYRIKRIFGQKIDFKNYSFKIFDDSSKRFIHLDQNVYNKFRYLPKIHILVTNRDEYKRKPNDSELKKWTNVKTSEDSYYKSELRLVLKK